MLMVRGLIGGLFQVALFAALLLIPAGTWHWPRAIQFLVAYSVVKSVSIVTLARVAPASLEARLQPPFAKTQPVADRVITFLIILSFAVWLAFIPLDVFHLHLLPTPSLGMSVFGAVLALAGYGLLIATLIQNAFALPIVREQSDRGHVLVDTGFYAHVRHPFYVGFIAFLAGLPLWLESYAGVLALPIVLITLVARIFVEEKTLRDTLPGYAEYMTRVRYRLIPLIW